MPAGRGKRRQMSWDEWYRLAAAYRDANGNLLVPKDYACPAGQKLGRWIERQRAKYNGVTSVRGHLDRTQIMLLNQIGMVWKLEYRHDWAEWLEKLDWYRSMYGNVDVPHSFEDGDFRLGNWLVEQRKSYAAGTLGRREIDDLEARGVCWSVKTRPRAWEDWYADAAAYYKVHGTLMVPLDYRTQAGDRLGTWVYGQRDIYMGRKPGMTLTAAQVERLEAINMVWSPAAARPEAWDRMYAWVSEYVRLNGKLPLWPRDLKAPDGRSMWGWIRTQRQMLADGRVPPSRKKQLAALGILPFEKRAANESAGET